MEEVIYLKKGEVYFYAAFLDEALKTPIISTFVFMGLEDGCYIFKNPVDDSYISLEEGKMSCIFDREALSKWLLEEHTQYRPVYIEYRYKLA